MLKYFCDRCGEQCSSTDSSARSFDKLATSKDNFALGLEVTPTLKGERGGSLICRECVPDLLILAAKTFTDSGVVAKQELMQADAKNHTAMKRILEQQLNVANKREKAAEQQILEAAQCIASAEEQKLADAEKIKVLEAQVTALQSKLDTAVRIKQAADKQLAEDVKGNPDYINAVERRERIRMGGGISK